MTREEARVWRKLEDYVKARHNFFKEQTQPAWKAWKAAELVMVSQYSDYIKREKKK